VLKIAHHESYCHPLPEGHRFPMEKYDLLPRQLLYEGTCTAENFFAPAMTSQEDVLAVHSEVYVTQLNEGTLDKRAAENRVSAFQGPSGKGISNNPRHH
jgi:acetoin utilization deacetylase AcuC-like enzyme